MTAELPIYFVPDADHRQCATCCRWTDSSLLVYALQPRGLSTCGKLSKRMMVDCSKVPGHYTLQPAAGAIHVGTLQASKG